MTTPKEALEAARNALVALRVRLNAEPAVQGRGWVSLGIVLNDAVEKANSALASLEGDAVERVALAFHSGENVPEVKIGSMQCCIVVTENEQGKHFAFPGYYLNAYPLQYDECRCDEPCEDGCPTTGWFYDESNWEYENCYYPISSKILRWALIPDARAILATGLVPDEAAKDAEIKTLRMALEDATSGITASCVEQEIRADEREKCAAKFQGKDIWTGEAIAAAIRSGGGE